MIGNPLLNPESGQVLETTSEKNILSGTRVGEEFFPLVVPDNTITRVYMSKERIHPSRLALFILSHRLSRFQK